GPRKPHSARVGSLARSFATPATNRAAHLFIPRGFALGLPCTLARGAPVSPTPLAWAHSHAPSPRPPRVVVLEILPLVQPSLGLFMNATTPSAVRSGHPCRAQDDWIP